jgi:Zn-dependent protease with chaperone function
MSYAFRLVCVSLAAFAIVHLATAIAVNAVALRAIRLAERMNARAAARFLLMLRLAPVAASLAIVGVLCVPSYLRFEPHSADEEVGRACLMLAALAAAMCLESGARALRAVRATRRWLRDRTPPNTVALAGLIRPRVMVAESVTGALSAGELEAAIRHERAHAASRDNLKRLAMLAAPRTIPFFPSRFAGIEAAWKKFSEWAADDCAASGDPGRSLALASALIRVARLGAAQAPPLVTSLVDGDLTARVDRLLAPVAEGRPDRWTPAILLSAAMALAVLISSPAALPWVHHLLERLIH